MVLRLVLVLAPLPRSGGSSGLILAELQIKLIDLTFLMRTQNSSLSFCTLCRCSSQAPTLAMTHDGLETLVFFLPTKTGSYLGAALIRNPIAKLLVPNKLISFSTHISFILPASLFTDHGGLKHVPQRCHSLHSGLQR